MKTGCFALLALTFIFCSPALTFSAGVSGCVTKQDSGDPITAASVYAFGVNNDIVVYLLDVAPSGDNQGCYMGFSPLLEEGETYSIEVTPYFPGPDTRYVQATQTITLVGENVTDNVLDFSLELGGNISGTITDEGDELVNGTPVSDNLNLGVFDSNLNWVVRAEIDWNSGGVYTTPAVPAGSYKLMFLDANDPAVYAEQYYDKIPDFAAGSALEISVNTDQTTDNIDMTIHKVADSPNRYYYAWPYLGTQHIRDNAGNLSSSVFAGSGYLRFSDGNRTIGTDVESFTVLAPAAENNCTQWATLTNAFFQWRAKNTNGDMLLDQPGEEPVNASLFTPDIYCNKNDAIHEAGTYILQTTFKSSSQVLSRAITREAALSTTALPPLSDLIANWDSSANTLALSWTRPDYDQNNLKANSGQIRIYAYSKGQYLNKRLRIDNLPTGLEGNTSFTLDSYMVSPINDPRIDQLQVEVRVAGLNNTTTKLLQGFNFDHKVTGELTPAKIGYVYDINGDRKTGLEEVIQTLQHITSP